MVTRGPAPAPVNAYVYLLDMRLNSRPRPRSRCSRGARASVGHLDLRLVTTPLTPVEVASALLREGRMGDAENLMTRELQAVTERHGHGSPEWAAAQCDLGNVLIEDDQRDRAIDCYRRAASATPRDHESRKDQL